MLKIGYITEAVLFSKNHKPKQKFLKLGGKFIKHETKVKYLGVTLDRRLSWRDHINDKIGRSGLSTWKYQFSYDH